MRLALEAWLEKNESRTALADLGANLKEWFADERARVAQAVEAAATPSRRKGDLPDLEHAAPADAGSRSSAPKEAAQSSIPASIATATGTATASSTGTAPFVASGSIAPPSPSRTPLYLGLAAVAVVGVVLGALALGRRPHDASAPTAPAPSSAPVEEAKVKLTIKASPTSAVIFLDEKQVEGNPHVATFPKGTGKHLVRAEAAGFVSKSELVDLNESMQIALALEVVPTAAPPTTKFVVVNGKSVGGGATAAASPTVTGPAPPTTATPPTSAAPLHTVDPANPYGKPTNGRGVDPNNPYGK